MTKAKQRAFTWYTAGAIVLMWLFFRILAGRNANVDSTRTNEVYEQSTSTPASPASNQAAKASGASSADGIVAAFSAARAAAAPAPVPRKVVMTANVTLEVQEFGPVQDEIVQLARQQHGYIADSHLNVPRDGAQSGTITIRVPQEKYAKVLTAIKQLGRLVVESQSAEDVTQQYVDLDARTRNLKVEEARILNIMKRAKTIAETLEVDRRLTELRERIEVQEGQLRYLKYQVAMATISVTLAENTGALHLPTTQWVWLNEVKSAWHSVVAVGQVVLTVLTYIVIFGVFWVPLLLLARFISRRKRNITQA